MKIELLQQELPADWQQVARVFTALGDNQRQRILLAFDADERLTASQISQASQLSRSAIAHHLKVLKDAGVLASHKEGKELYLWIDKALIQESLRRVQDYLQHDL